MFALKAVDIKRSFCEGFFLRNLEFTFKPLNGALNFMSFCAI